MSGPDRPTAARTADSSSKDDSFEEGLRLHTNDESSRFHDRLLARERPTRVKPLAGPLRCTRVVFRGEAAPISSGASAPISAQLFNPCQRKEPKSDTRVLGLVLPVIQCGTR